MPKTSTKNTDKIKEPGFAIEPEEMDLTSVEDYRCDNGMFVNACIEQDLEDHGFYECIFKNCEWKRGQNGIAFRDVILTGCDFSNINFDETVCHRVVFRNCRFTGTDLTRSTLEDTVFENCNLVYANFSGSKMKRCRITDTVAKEAAFAMCDLQHMSFGRCDLSGCEFFDTKLQGIDLSDSEIDGIQVGPDTLKGVIVNEEQAIACAKILEIVVKR